ncbi:MAG: hypothetical protein ACR2PG_20030 [Hyphomicrobiaceae bacterium]
MFQAFEMSVSNNAPKDAPTIKTCRRREAIQNSQPRHAGPMGRTAGTNLVRLGVLPHVRERVLNQVIPGVEGIYDQYSWLDEKRDALNRYNAFLQELLCL